ncbi:helix-turn-helix domain-containing protein [Corynebacterium uberis]|uniref:helix-turn-helix domain-containing protein n=1 Tax=Corynebacterium TaxID=1716 RepID=UPI001D0ABCFF|nr:MULTISPECIES: helix-turn-helix transcriptional regulator [Corynebacterium]MCZ9308476.1 helix-turn-helix domain-containing protein [Corynebacterium sp. c6VSa_13]UDL74690.1 helix-turn-helix domain-containing protein [Corynebacterium uberis]UDL76967.1 helix-turn-helix domain-containing protein [Corynebacterium uberis]UDL79177.1 helix-turn-helix domain-containing protein [Corynebacterium uberis]UDL81383.1 helix-turn-helix domain-containing protein [Corynebacterium uberis]
MVTHTAVLDKPSVVRTPVRHPEPLLRQALGEALRGFRAEAHVTLRELAEASNVSLSYLSELERGRKEVSSEVLAAICHALGASVADVLIEAAGTMALHDVADELARAPRTV